MVKKFISVLSEEKIIRYSAVPLSSVRMIRQDKLSRMDLGENGSLLVMLIPYYVSGEKRNISVYAVPRDYHLYFSILGEKLVSALKEDFPGFVFRTAADNSPVDEVDAAVRSGLGFFGDNGLFISPEYGSFVFIGGIYSDMPCENYGIPSAVPGRRECSHCGKCRKACPGDPSDKRIGCLSAITQKKGTLTSAEAEMIRKTGTAWGCDICQQVCPFNTGIKDTEISFFLENRTPYLTYDYVKNMSDCDFSSRAYSWRKRETILRNLAILEGKEEESGGI